MSTGEITAREVASRLQAGGDGAFLSFHNGGFRAVDPSAFEASTKVRGLNLSFNRIQEIEQGVLEPLKNLRSLQLHGNRLADVSTLADGCSQRLEDLTLNANEIRSLPHNLRGLRNLVRLRRTPSAGARALVPRLQAPQTPLTPLPLPLLPRSPTQTPRRQKRLRLGGNRLQSAPSLHVPTTLVALEIGRNAPPLTRVRGIGAAVNLRVLDLSYNELDGGSLAELRSLTRLEELDITHNHVASLRALAPLRSLETLRAGENHVEALSPETLPPSMSVAELYLPRNRISSASDLAGLLPSVDVLDLADNRLPSLSQLLLALAPLQDLRELTVQGNPCAPREDAEVPQTAMRFEQWTRELRQALPRLECADEGAAQEPLKERCELLPMEDIASIASAWRSRLESAKCSLSALPSAASTAAPAPEGDLPATPASSDRKRGRGEAAAQRSSRSALRKAIDFSERYRGDAPQRPPPESAAAKETSPLRRAAKCAAAKGASDGAVAAKDREGFVGDDLWAAAEADERAAAAAKELSAELMAHARRNKAAAEGEASAPRGGLRRGLEARGRRAAAPPEDWGRERGRGDRGAEAEAREDEGSNPPETRARTFAARAGRGGARRSDAPLKGALRAFRVPHKARDKMAASLDEGRLWLPK